MTKTIADAQSVSQTARSTLTCDKAYGRCSLTHFKSPRPMSTQGGSLTAVVRLGERPSLQMATQDSNQSIKQLDALLGR